MEGRKLVKAPVIQVISLVRLTEICGLLGDCKDEDDYFNSELQKGMEFLEHWKNELISCSKRRNETIDRKKQEIEESIYLIDEQTKYELETNPDSKEETEYLTKLALLQAEKQNFRNVQLPVFTTEYLELVIDHAVDMESHSTQLDEDKNHEFNFTREQSVKELDRTIFDLEQVKANKEALNESRIRKYNEALKRRQIYEADLNTIESFESGDLDKIEKDEENSLNYSAPTQDELKTSKVN